ncbi:MAG: hypothetical protein H6765_09435 [Candidatus Peribacteria bacterium]|nr:MAG: hypothetical protein H6765_09435 [Candidatus Peribacteria bacterium]
MRQDVDVPTLTTYGCYTIGSNKDRWVNVATLSNMVANLGNLNTTQKLLTKNTVTEHAAAPETPATTETNSNKSTAATTSKPSLAEQLAQSNISKSPIEPVVLKPQEHAAPADLATDVLPTAVVPKVTETPVETKPVTSSDDVPLTIRIKYQ